MRGAFLVVGLMAIIGTSANAGDSSSGAYSILGFGGKSCGTYVEVRRQRSIDEAVFGAWLGGYITATNRRLDHTYDIAGSTDMGPAGVAR